MYAKVEITGTIEVLTGLHIGGSEALSAIGAVDSPVMKDVRTGLPVLPGSSLKGKMRALLAKQYNETIAKRPDEDAPCLQDLFGYARRKDGKAKLGRLLFCDAVMSNWETLKAQGLTARTEIKLENTINRTTGVAALRQIERTVRGAEFPLHLIYECVDEETMKVDFGLIRDGLRLIECDYLGGNGTRGYGKVKFHGLDVRVVVGAVEEAVVTFCRKILCEK